jgi:hypothetical protein
VRINARICALTAFVSVGDGGWIGVKILGILVKCAGFCAAFLKIARFSAESHIVLGLCRPISASRRGENLCSGM